MYGKISSIVALNISMHSPSGPPDRFEFKLFILLLISSSDIANSKSSVLRSWARFLKICPSSKLACDAEESNKILKYLNQSLLFVSLLHAGLVQKLPFIFCQNSFGFFLESISSDLFPFQIFSFSVYTWP